MNADNPATEAPSKRLNKSQFRIVVTAGMGFFTDAYDLFIIGVVTAILAPIWHLSIEQLALLNGASLAAAAFGAVFFGSMSDKLGRKKLYGVEILILFFGAIFAASAMNFTWLFIARIVVGFGIGGDYPSSAIVVSEHASTEKRGFLVLLVFAMQALGLVVGPMLASLLLSTHLPDAIIWRILLGLGAIPALSVFFLRRKIQETPHYKLSKKVAVASRVVHDLADISGEGEQQGYKKQSIFSKKWLVCLMGTAGAWFLLDVAFYGNGVSSVLIMDAINPHADLLHHTIISALIFLVFAVPGYALAAKYVDKVGRKPLQYLGFIMIAICFAMIAFIPGLTEMVPMFLAVFGVSFFFVNFGPNTTTFLIPSEIYPTSIRAKAHGLSAAIGKVGAFVGVFFLPIILHKYGLQVTMGLMSVVALAGVAMTLLIPEMSKVDLSETELSH